MQVCRYSSAHEFLQDVQAFLEKDEATNNLPLGILLILEQKPEPDGEVVEPFFALVEHSGDISLIMVMTPPHHLVVYGEGKDLDRAIDASVSFLLQEEVSVPSVIGPRDVAARFASLWTRQTGCTTTVEMEQMIYRLDSVNEIPLSSGALVCATSRDIDLLSDWTLKFADEIALERLSHDDARRRAEQAVGEGRVFLWHDKVPVSRALKARPSRNGIVVTGVYTPPQFRNRGYATSCVASLSKLLLNQGYRFCSLYTDLSNPMSNRIYRRIGYYPVRRSIVYSFGQAS